MKKLLFYLFTLSVISCNVNSNSVSSQNYEFSYGLYKKIDASSNYPYIYTVYKITSNSLEIILYNEKRHAKNLIELCSLKWANPKNGSKLGYNEEKNSCVVFYNNKFYFQNSASASSLIADFKNYNTYDTSLFLNSLSVDLYNASSVTNLGLIKMSSNEIDNFNNSINSSHDEVLSEMINSIN